jgi:asparagine synthetase B (glutamine-hydrolysing)
MAGMAGVFLRERERLDLDAIDRSINPLSIDTTNRMSLDEGVMMVVSPSNTPIRGARHFENERFACCVAGDLVDVEEIPWEMFVEFFRSECYDEFPELPGLFALAVFDKTEKRLFIVSDVFGIYPVYLGVRGDSVAFSTTVATFAKLPQTPPFNAAWLFEYLYFSFPVRRTTIWKDVYRVLPATIVRCDLESRTLASVRYGPGFRREEQLLTGMAAAERALEVFRDRVPRYFKHADRFAHAITAGYDTRTVLAFVPEELKDRMESYTYGLSRSNDIRGARLIAERFGVEHREIFFDDRYVTRLPDLIYETVCLAGGIENINRAYLPYVYRLLTDNGTRLPVITSGIGSDAIFRGHVPTPNGLSYDMEQAYLTGKKVINDLYFKRMFGSYFDDFRSHIDRALDDMIEAYDGFGSVDGYFQYEIYDGLPRYFNGEAYIANHFAAFRTPLLDPQIIRLACEIEYSLFTLWRFINDDEYKETFIQSYLIASNPELARIPLAGLPLRAYTSRNKLLYHWYRITRKGPRKLVSVLTRAEKPKLEDWDLWYTTVLKGELDRLFSKDSMLSNYINMDMLAELRARRDMHWLKLLATTEICMRLAAAGWDLDRIRR